MPVITRCLSFVLLFSVLLAPTPITDLEPACVGKDPESGPPLSVSVSGPTLDGTSCLAYRDWTDMENLIRKGGDWPTIVLSDTFEKTTLVIDFRSQAFTPDIVHVTSRYGASNSLYQPITSCFAERVVMLDGRPKNETCAVRQSTDDLMTIEFGLQGVNANVSGGEIVLLLAVEWMNDAATSPQEYLNVFGYAITIKEPS